MPDIDCDVCHPEIHQNCKGKPYNGAAPMGGTQQHHRCPNHRHQTEDA